MCNFSPSTKDTSVTLQKARTPLLSRLFRRHSLPLISVTRSGTLHAPHLIREGRCGNEGLTSFPYSITLTGTSLEPHTSFLIDNATINRRAQTFDTPPSTPLRASCEELCGGLIHALYAPHISSIRVTIHPHPDVVISVSWKKGQPLPTFHPHLITRISSSPYSPPPSQIPYEPLPEHFSPASLPRKTPSLEEEVLTPR